MGERGDESNVGRVARLDPQALLKRLDAGETPQFIDLREAHEFALNHFRGAINIPFAELPGRLQEIQPGRDVVLYCGDGRCAERAAPLLKAKGFSQVMVLEGGVAAWHNQVSRCG